MITVYNLRSAGRYLNADPRTIQRLVPTNLYLKGSTGRLDPAWYEWDLDDWRELVQLSQRRGRAPARPARHNRGQAGRVRQG